MDLHIYIDESGSIPSPTTFVGNNDIFVISLIISKNPNLLKRNFKKGIVKICNRFDDCNNEFVNTGEIKGTNLLEKQKNIIFNCFTEKCYDTTEIGIICLHNNKADARFREVSARAFNYLIWKFLLFYYHDNKIYNQPINKMHLHIDERNVSTNAKYDLYGYLEMKNFELDKPMFQELKVDYVDSKNVALVQLSDMVANSFYRWLRFGKNGTKPKSITILEKFVSKHGIFHYPKYYSEKG